MFFLPLEQSVHYPDVLMQHSEIQTHFVSSIQLLVRGDTRNLEPRLRKALADIDPNLTIITVQSMNEQVASNFDQQRMVAQLAGTFGLIAMLLAAIGLYRLTTYTVACRTSEIGVRMALGANRLNIVRLPCRITFSRMDPRRSDGQFSCFPKCHCRLSPRRTQVDLHLRPVGPVTSVPG
jgi:hypothetical protein